MFSQDRYNKRYAMGMISRDDQVIRIKRLASRQRMVEMLLHEIFHGLAVDGALDTMQGFDPIHEEVVDRFSKGLTRLIANNPGLMSKLEAILTE